MKLTKEQALKKIKELEEFIKQEDTIDLFSITTYKDVCKILKEKEYKLSDFKDFKEAEQLLAFQQIKQIQKLYNEGSKNNIWYPYFYASGGFCGSIFDGYSYVGQVCFYKDRKTSDYIGRTFENIYRKIK
jgi:hypothetical protein